MKRKQPSNPSQERGPLVGIFWVDTENKDITLIHADPVKSVERDRGTEFINGPHAHFAIWDLLKAKDLLPEKWRDLEYQIVPRGRVLYDFKNKKFKVYGRKKLTKLKWFQNAVLNHFNLPGDQTGFYSDPHYEIDGPEFIDDPSTGLMTSMEYKGKEALVDLDNRPLARELFSNLKDNLPELEKLFEDCPGPWGYEDLIYRFYHQSFKVYNLQKQTVKIVSDLQALLPGATLNDWFSQIIKEGTGKTFASEDNENWVAVTRPIIEAFFHARYFLEMAVKYGRELDFPPRFLPSGWAAFLYLYNLR
jgi:hypothetical protein